MDSKLSSDIGTDYFLDVNQAISKEEEYTCYLCSATYEKDLELAAELGKTLLERNKELETALKNHQNIIEDQSQEIEYLTKQTAGLKEVNTSRIKIYEQLEISIQDLEHANETLTHQNLADKKQIKNLLEIIETLESQCEELKYSFDQISSQLENERKQRTLNSSTETNENERSTKRDCTTNLLHFKEQCSNCIQISSQLQEFKAAYAKDQKCVVDLREQMSSLLQENNFLQEQLDTLRCKDEELKSIQEELATLEQIRLGNLCKRCLRSTIPPEDCSSADELSLILTNEDETEITQSIAGPFFNNNRLSPTLETHADNPYRILVEKYEALLKMQEQQQQLPRYKIKNSFAATTKPCMSLHDELQLIGNYYDNDKKYQTDSEIEDENESLKSHKKKEFLKINSPLSVLSSENICHQSTQTDMSTVLPGSLLCKISEGNDCQFSIYDDASPIESRFRKTPEYRQLFKEIFAVLKRAAEAKDEGESLPLLDDRLLSSMNQLNFHPQFKIPSVIPAEKEGPFTMTKTSSEPCVTAVDKGLDMKSETKHTQLVEIGNVEKQQSSVVEEQERQPEVRHQLTEGMKSCMTRAQQSMNRYDKKNVAVVHQISPSPSPSHSRSTSNKRRSGSRARKKREHFIDSPHRSRERHQQKSNKSVEMYISLDNFEHFDLEKPKVNFEPLKKGRPISMYTFTSGNSTASKEVAKLKILEKSYAEVLRMGRKKKL